MKVNPLVHKDFKGLFLNKIDERILLKNSIKGVRMYQKKLTYERIMKRD